MRTIDIFLEKLTTCLRETNLTMAAFSRGVKINVRTIRHWFNDGMPNIESLIKTADFFGCSVDYLMGKNDLEFDFQPDRYTVDFWNRYAALKQAAGLNDYQISKACQVGRGTVSKWVHGRLPDLEMLRRLCEVFDTSYEYLLGRVD